MRVVFPEEEGHALHCLVLVKGPYFLPSFASYCFYKFGCGCVPLNVLLMQVHVKTLPYIYVSLLPEWLLRQVYQVCQIQMIKQYLNCKAPGHRHSGLDLTTCSDSLCLQQADRLASSITDYTECMSCVLLCKNTTLVCVISGVFFKIYPDNFKEECRVCSQAVREREGSSSA